MAVSQARPKRKPSGSRYIAWRKGRKYELGREPVMTKIGGKKLKLIRVRGGSEKPKLMMADYANVIDPKTKKAIKAKISIVVENPANRHFARRNVLTKGTIIDTDKGKARITGRPGQDGIVNAVLIQ